MLSKIRYAMISAGPSNAEADMSSQSSPFPATHSIQGNMGYKQVEGIEIKPMEPTVEMPPMEMKLHYGKSNRPCPIE